MKRRDEGTRLYLLIFLLVQGLPFVIWGFTDFGKKVDTEFYSASAQVIPVLFVALVVELGFRFRHHSASLDAHRDLEGKLGVLKRGEEELREIALRGLPRGEMPKKAFAERASIALEEELKQVRVQIERTGLQARKIVFAYTTAATPGLYSALTALALNGSTTSLFLCTCLSILFMVLILLATFSVRLTPY